MRRWKGELTALVIIANVGFLTLAILTYWPQWWLAVNSDRSPRAWFFSVQLAAIGFAAILAFYLSRPEKQSWLWALLGAGFFFLSLDKHFRWHERLREEFFIPHDIGTRVPGVRRGDLMPLIYAAGGVALSGAMFRWLKVKEKGWWLAGIAFAALAVVLDIGYFPLATNQTLRWMQFSEKLLQTAAQVCFLCVIVRHNCERIYGR